MTWTKGRRKKVAFYQTPLLSPLYPFSSLSPPSRRPEYWPPLAAKEARHSSGRGRRQWKAHRSHGRGENRKGGGGGKGREGTVLRARFISVLINLQHFRAGFTLLFLVSPLQYRHVSILPHYRTRSLGESIGSNRSRTGRKSSSAASRRGEEIPERKGYGVVISACL